MRLRVGANSLQLLLKSHTLVIGYKKMKERGFAFSVCQDEIPPLVLSMCEAAIQDWARLSPADGMVAKPPLGSPAPLLGESVTPKASKMLRCLATVLCAILLAGLWMSNASKTEGRAFWLCQVDVEALTDLSGFGPAQVLLFASSLDSYKRSVSLEVLPSLMLTDSFCGLRNFG